MVPHSALAMQLDYVRSQIAKVPILKKWVCVFSCVNFSLQDKFNAIHPTQIHLIHHHCKDPHFLSLRTKAKTTTAIQWKSSLITEPRTVCLLRIQITSANPTFRVAMTVIAWAHLTFQKQTVNHSEIYKSSWYDRFNLVMAKKIIY